MISTINPASLHTYAILALTVVALLLFTRRSIPLETSALVILGLLVLGFELFPYQGVDGQTIKASSFFSGFGHPALIAVSALMVAGHGLVRTGALVVVSRVLAKMWKVSPKLSLLGTMLIAAILSAFINNTPIVILLLPILVSVSLRNGINPSSILIPMNYATLLGGMGTTIGTSTNLLVVSVAADMGLRHFGLFDFALPAVIVGSVGIVYLWLVAPKLLPKREIAMGDGSTRLFTAHLHVQKGSLSIGKTLSQLIDETSGRLNVQRIVRSRRIRIVSLPDATVKKGDRLLVQDTPQNLKDFEQSLGVELYAGNHIMDEEHPLQAADQQLAEVVIYPGSPLHRSTLSESRFTDQTLLAVLAIHRAGRAIEKMPEGIAHLRLRMGDVLLVQGSREEIDKLKHQPDLMVLDATLDLPHTSKAPLSLAVMAGMVALSALGILPIHISAPLGVLAMLICGCLSWKDVSQALSTQLILIIVATLALGQAMLLTGGSELVASTFVALTENASPAFILGGLILLMAVLTNVVSNNAAAVIGTPIAISIARAIGAPEEPFVLGVLFGANMSFVTPMAYQTNLLVMNAGGYHFSDFVRVGLPLAVIYWLGITVTLTMLYGV